ncbi:DUF3180 domain-containing protein [Bifidobacterium sp. AGR2158]|uniref:DUF3180 domain-containing protein n=1 Tax=Bifidobacterium sp. AGR2158 TaxID=1280675 RepID=UPI0006847FCB|nr:DUF3180 domain-containing protein [Bifidobacterium sp. AGR2158]
MRAHRIRWWVYLLAVVLGVGGGAATAMLEERHHVSLLGLPWFVSAVLAVFGIGVLVAAWQVHRYTTTEPRKRVQLKTITPERAVDTLILTKALALAGAVLLGWYGGELLMVLGHLQAPYYRRIAIECVVACAASLIDMVCGIIGEGFCQLPPSEGPEHPKIERKRLRNGRRDRGVAWKADGQDGDNDEAAVPGR